MVHIVTGGSSGLGFEIAKGLCLQGEAVVLMGRDGNKLEKAKVELMTTCGGAKVHVHAADLSNELSVGAFFQSLDVPIQSFINCAGTPYFGKIVDVSRHDIDEVLKSNLIGLILATSKALEHMINYPIKGQRILSVLSTAALKGKKNEAIYNAAKWGARGFLESLRDEASVEVINVFPGGMKTPFWDESPSGYAVNTFMLASDVAKHIVNLLLDHSVYIQDITIGRPK